MVRPGGDLTGYALVVVPTLINVTDAALSALSMAEGTILIGPRAGSRDRSFRVPETLPPGPLAALTGTRVTQVASLRPGVTQAVTGVVSGAAERWRDHVQTTAQVLARFPDAGPALTQKGRVLAIHGWPDPALLASLMAYATQMAGLETLPLPPHIRLRRRGNWWIFTNYGPESWTLPPCFRFLLGGNTLPPQGVTIAERAAP